MISMFLNCAKVWTRLVQSFHRVTGRPQVTLDRPAPPTGAVRP